MDEEVSKDSIRLAIRGTKITKDLLVKALKAYVNHRQKVSAKKKIEKNQPVQGKQSVKSLIQQGQGVTSIPLADDGLKDFQKMAKKYGVDFSIVKDKGKDPPVYTVFFKAKDTDAITKILDDYAAKQLKKEKQRPSVLEKLQKFKKKVAEIPRKVLEKKKVMER